MSARRAPAVTLAQLRKMPAAIDVTTAAAALDVGRSTLYAAIRAGDCPVRVLHVRTRMKIVTASVIELLEPSASQAGAGLPEDARAARSA